MLACDTPAKTLEELVPDDATGEVRQPNEVRRSLVYAPEPVLFVVLVMSIWNVIWLDETKLKWDRMAVAVRSGWPATASSKVTVRVSPGVMGAACAVCSRAGKAGHDAGAGEEGSSHFLVQCLIICTKRTSSQGRPARKLHARNQLIELLKLIYAISEPFAWVVKKSDTSLRRCMNLSERSTRTASISHLARSTHVMRRDAASLVLV
jgi:hypothetical protein